MMYMAKEDVDAAFQSEPGFSDSERAKSPSNIVSLKSGFSSDDDLHYYETQKSEAVRFKTS